MHFTDVTLDGIIRLKSKTRISSVSPKASQFLRNIGYGTTIFFVNLKLACFMES